MTKQHLRMNAEHSHTSANNYGRLLVMGLLSFASMYVLMYAMVNAFGNVYLNVNRFYMAGLMTAPMVMTEVALMSAMYHRKKLNAAVAASLVAFWLLIRQQVAVGDKQFLRSMIPHHGGAILMCAKASISNPDVKRLCESIRSSQQAEIDLMKVKLAELESK